MSEKNQPNRVNGKLKPGDPVDMGRDRSVPVENIQKKREPTGKKPRTTYLNNLKKEKESPKLEGPATVKLSKTEKELKRKLYKKIKASIRESGGTVPHPTPKIPRSKF